MLSKGDPAQQLVYYQAGIGTYTIPQKITPFMAKLSMIKDMMFGSHLDAHVMGGYEFLMQNYQAGNKICLFGFSRGAYTARALAGMVHQVGLLPRCNHQQVPFAYYMYSRDSYPPDDKAKCDKNGRDETKCDTCDSFKETFSIDVDIEFVGVWDTVDSVGVIPHKLPFTKANNSIRYFRHALSLDERRVRFRANHWHWKKKDPEDGVTYSKMSNSTERTHESRRITETNVVEVWFAGTHGDVGGGTVVNGTPHSLARISLRWMVKQCFLTKTGIIFRRSMMKKFGINPETLLQQTTDDLTVVVRNDGELCVNDEQEDLADATRSEIHDQLSISPGWWILEVIPQIFRYQRDENGQWVDKIVVNMGAGRRVPLQHKNGVKAHRTVKHRMEADNLPGGKYSPKAKLHHDVQITWVD